MPDLATSIRHASPLLKASLGVHGAAIAALALEPTSAALAAGTIVANHIVLGLAGLHMRGSWLGPTLTKLPGAAPHVALTFDDGPDPEVTPRVLDLLDAAGQRGTFFCVGARAEQHPGIVAEAQRRGHGVENHTYTHPNSFSLKGPRAIRDEVWRTQDAVARITGQPPAWFRPPAGIQTPWLADILLDAGLGLAAWTRRGLDTVTKDPERVLRRLVGPGVRGGDILLLHDCRTGSAAPAPVILAVLPPLLQALEEAGLRSRPLGEVATPLRLERS